LKNKVKTCAVIVAHPDDETLWSGGTILGHPEWQWFVVSLCRKRDKERAARFYQAMSKLSAAGAMGDLDDGPGQSPQNTQKVEQTVLGLLPTTSFDLIKFCCIMPRGLFQVFRVPPAGVIQISWVEEECRAMMDRGLLSVDLPPNFFPFIQPTDKDWHESYGIFNRPGYYHNGGIWPFICAIYIAALVAARKYRLAKRKLLVLTRLMGQSRIGNAAFGFNE